MIRFILAALLAELRALNSLKRKDKTHKKAKEIGKKQGKKNKEKRRVRESCLLQLAEGMSSFDDTPFRNPSALPLTGA